MDRGGTATRRGAVLFAAILLVTGPRFVDVDALAALYAEPFRLLGDPADRYLHSSVANIFVGYLVGAVSPHRVQALAIAAALAAVGAVLLYGHRAIAESDERWAFFSLLALSPLLHVLAFWLGKSDPYLVGSYFLLLLARRPAVIAVLAMAMTLAHPEQATVILAVHAAMHRPARAWLLAVLAGWAAGAGMAQLYLAELGLAGSPRAAWAGQWLERLLRNNVARPVTMLWLSFSWFWIPVIAYVWAGRRTRVLALAGICFVIAGSSADFTRVFTLISLPLAVHVARALSREAGGVLGPRLGRLTPLGFLQMELAIGRVWDNGWAVLLMRALGVTVQWTR
jgi:hypothetical protein